MLYPLNKREVAPQAHVGTYERSLGARAFSVRRRIGITRIRLPDGSGLNASCGLIARRQAFGVAPLASNAILFP